MPRTKKVNAELYRLGSNIRRERNAKRMSQERLAELAELNLRTIQKIEAGQLNILITTLMRIHRGLSCRWDDLLPKR